MIMYASHVTKADSAPLTSSTCNGTQEGRTGSKYRQAILDAAVRLVDQLQLRKRRKRSSHGDQQRRVKASSMTPAQTVPCCVHKEFAGNYEQSLSKRQSGSDDRHRIKEFDASFNDSIQQSHSEQSDRGMHEATDEVALTINFSDSALSIPPGKEEDDEFLPEQAQGKGSKCNGNTLSKSDHVQMPFVSSEEAITGSTITGAEIRQSPPSSTKTLTTVQQNPCKSHHLPAIQEQDQPPMKPFLRRRTSRTEWDNNTSAIPLMSPSMRIPTCFRIAELLRLINDKVDPPPFAIELYAIPIHWSDVESGKRGFCLADIFFPQRPPYICGSMNSRQNNLFVQRSRSDQDRDLIRAIVRPLSPRSLCLAGPLPMQSATGQSIIVKAFVDVLSMRASTWDEVRYVRGIVDPQE